MTFANRSTVRSAKLIDFNPFLSNLHWTLFVKHSLQRLVASIKTRQILLKLFLHFINDKAHRFHVNFCKEINVNFFEKKSITQWLLIDCTMSVISISGFNVSAKNKRDKFEDKKAEHVDCITSIFNQHRSAISLTANFAVRPINSHAKRSKAH